MRVVQLKAENYKRLTAVDITPEGNSVIIAGKNAQGKSSVLDSIWAAIAGTAGAKQTSQPIHDGETQASVTVDLGDFIVTRKWTQKGTTLTVTNGEGLRYPTPQKMLDGLTGKLTFDPLAFAQQDPKEQRKTLLSVVKLPFDPEELELERRSAFEQRTEVNREVKRLEAALSEIGKFPEDTPDEEVRISDLIADRDATQASLDTGSTLLAEWDTLSTEEGALRQRLNDIVQRKSEIRSATEGLPSSSILKATLGDINEKIERADEINANVRRRQEHMRVAGGLSDHMTEARILTARLAEIEQRKVDGIAAAEMPVEGLSFDEDGVLYNGIPFSQSSGAEKLRVSVAMAMSMNPSIRVIRITDGSLLDSDNMALIDQMAAENDFQVWIERVDEGDVGIVIEDGAVRNA